MRASLAILALTFFPHAVPSEGAHSEIQVVQAARDVTDAVRRQRAERRARSHQDHQSNEERKR
jgi:hypothetical protein